MNTTARPLLGALPHRFNRFGQIAPVSTVPRLRLRFADGEGGDGGAGGDGSSAGDGGDGADGNLGDAGKRAIDSMKNERNTARDALKAYTNLGATPEEIKALLDARDAGKGPDEETIAKRVRSEVERETAEKTAARYRASNVREQAATLGFIDPKDALALLDGTKLAAVDVTADGDVDEDEIKKLLEELATKKPHLVKTKDGAADHRTAGIGSGSSGSKPDVQPGKARLAQAYADATKKR